MLEGRFQPAPPASSEQVLRLFAVAARVVYAEPDILVAVTERLNHVTLGLVPPESLAAKDCSSLWTLFARVVMHPKPVLRREASRALLRDLDSLGQRLHLPPMPAWNELPETWVEECSKESEDDMALSLDEIAAEVRRRHQELGPGESVSGGDILSLLGRLRASEHPEFAIALKRSGHLSASEASLLQQALSKGVALTREDEMLHEVIQRIGAWLVHYGNNRK